MVNDPGGRDGLSKKRLIWEEQWNKVSNGVPIEIASSFNPPANISIAERKEACEKIRLRLSLSGSYPIGGSRAVLQDIPKGGCGCLYRVRHILISCPLGGQNLLLCRTYRRSYSKAFPYAPCHNLPKYYSGIFGEGVYPTALSLLPHEPPSLELSLLARTAPRTLNLAIRGRLHPYLVPNLKQSDEGSRQNARYGIHVQRRLTEYNRPALFITLRYSLSNPNPSAASGPSGVPAASPSIPPCSDCPMTTLSSAILVLNESCSRSTRFSLSTSDSRNCKRRRTECSLTRVSCAEEVGVVVLDSGAREGSRSSGWG
jgi:hypothetical protein